MPSASARHEPRAGKHQTAQEAVASIEGAEAYPYDPALKLDAQRGLDRLRCFADRALAASLYAVFQAVERNTAEAATAARDRIRKREAELERLRAVATRAISGDLGSEVKELAACLLSDGNRAQTDDERALRDFALALQRLRTLKR
jgi:predicted aconitase